MGGGEVGHAEAGADQSPLRAAVVAGQGASAAGKAPADRQPLRPGNLSEEQRPQRADRARAAAPASESRGPCGPRGLFDRPQPESVLARLRRYCAPGTARQRLGQTVTFAASQKGESHAPVWRSGILARGPWAVLPCRAAASVGARTFEVADRSGLASACTGASSRASHGRTVRLVSGLRSPPPIKCRGVSPSRGKEKKRTAPRG